MTLKFLSHRKLFFIWLAVSLLLLAVVLILIFSRSEREKDTQGVLVPPLTLPVSLSAAGEIVNTRIRVIDHNIYYFKLRFFFREKDKEDRARIRRLTGGNEVDKSGKAMNPGVPMPMFLRIACVNGNKETGTVYQKEIDPLLTSWGADNFGKEIGFTELPPGIYDVKLILHHAALAFDGTPVAISIGYDKFKTSFKPKLDRQTVCKSNSPISTPPLSFPFSARKIGARTEFQFSIAEKVGYTFSLCIYHNKNDPDDRERVRKLVGDGQINQFGEFTNTGIPIPLRLKVVRQDAEIGQKVVDGVFSKHVRFASDSDGFYKKIVDVVLDPGDYKGIIENLDNVHELASTEIKFCVTRTHGK